MFVSLAFGQNLQLVKNNSRDDRRIAHDVGQRHFAGGSGGQGQQSRNFVRSTA